VIVGSLGIWLTVFDLGRSQAFAGFANNGPCFTACLRADDAAGHDHSVGSMSAAVCIDLAHTDGAMGQWDRIKAIKHRHDGTVFHLAGPNLFVLDYFLCGETIRLSSPRRIATPLPFETRLL
jgi:hypothetical protein